ncbi:hypothetical protein [Parvularcula maris]|uniref:Uncharacterized protein n=1 Tax=Parvularcula maris TaxID=2965077 RepID=A0A9X2RK10_9PROT|nr:hypothetical protein [Parvularcula maris]MCQ8186436.1 hypothetical protein [Parvularcula maris]
MNGLLTCENAIAGLERAERVREELERRKEETSARLASIAATQDEWERVVELRRQIEALEAEMPNALALLRGVTERVALPSDPELRKAYRAAEPRTALRKRAERLFDAAMKVGDQQRMASSYELVLEATNLQQVTMRRATT